MCVCALVGV